ncbi:hypothetical protein G3I78_18545 [Streptomyces sp. SID13726]|nr:hypothetical protein [Streptomyces sp. SID13726]
MLLVLFLLPLLWGVIDLLRAGAARGAPECPGLQLGEDGEDHPGAMRKGYTCALDYDTSSGRSVGTSSYEQVKYGQEVKRKSLSWQGTGFVLYGAAGIVVTAAATRGRKSAA